MLHYLCIMISALHHHELPTQYAHVVDLLNFLA